MKIGRTDVDTLRINGWGPGTVLESTVKGKTDRVMITAVGKVQILCLWDHGYNGFWESETFLTSISHRDWKFVENLPDEASKLLIPLKTEEYAIVETIKAARNIQEFLWSEMNDNCGLEEIKRMFRKRVAKIDEISMNNPHWKVEFKKRLLQVAAIAVNFITKADNDQINHDGIHPTLESNLPQYAEDKLPKKDIYSSPIKNPLLSGKKEEVRKIFVEDDECCIDRASIIAYKNAKNHFGKCSKRFDSIHVKFISKELIGMGEIQKIRYEFDTWVEKNVNSKSDDFWT